VPKITKKEVRGVMYDIHVDENGTFFSVVNEDKITGPTMDILLKRMQQATAPGRNSLKIEFSRLRGGDDGGVRGGEPEIVHGVVTGKHATNDNMLVRIEGEKGSKQESMYSFGRRGDERYMRMTAAQEEEMLGIAKEIWQLKIQLNKLVAKYSFDVKKEVNDALSKLGVKED